MFFWVLLTVRCSSWPIVCSRLAGENDMLVLNDNFKVPLQLFIRMPLLGISEQLLLRNYYRKYDELMPYLNPVLTLTAKSLLLHRLYRYDFEYRFYRHVPR